MTPEPAKRYLLSIGTPHNRVFAPEYILSLFALLDNPALAVEVKFQQGVYVHLNRNKIFTTFRGDWLMFIDADVQFEVQDILKLIEANKPIVAGMYPSRHNERLEPIIFEFDESGKASKIQGEIPQKPFRVEGIGVGFTLIKKETAKFILSKNTRPFDHDQHDDGEDLAFCRVCKSLGVEIWCHPGVRPGHWGTKMYQFGPEDC